MPSVKCSTHRLASKGTMKPTQRMLLTHREMLVGSDGSAKAALGRNWGSREEARETANLFMRTLVMSECKLVVSMNGLGMN